MDDLKILSWPDVIKNNPGRYYPYLSNEGCVWLIEKFIDSLINTKYQCHADYIEIRLTRHNEVVIEYNGKGFPISIDQQSEFPTPDIYSPLMSFYSDKLTDNMVSKYGHLVEIGSRFNVACKTLRLFSVHKMDTYSVSFKQGCISTPLHKTKLELSLNRVQFEFDKNILGDFLLTEEMLIDIFKKCQLKHKNIKIQYCSSRQKKE